MGSNMIVDGLRTYGFQTILMDLKAFEVKISYSSLPVFLNILQPFSLTDGSSPCPLNPHTTATPWETLLPMVRFSLLFGTDLSPALLLNYILSRLIHEAFFGGPSSIYKM